MRTNNIQIETTTNASPQPVSIRHVRNIPPLAPKPLRVSDCRAYQRHLRAAEMAAWEQTGGDYLLSNCVTPNWRSA